MKIQTTAAAILISLLTACKPSVPEATDEQLATLLGGTTEYDKHIISPRLLECLQIMSGQAEDIFMDAPAEFIGMLKTGCRKDLDKRIKDEARNPLGFQMENFEDQELATRVQALFESQRERLEIERAKREKARLEEKQRREQQKDQENIEKLEQAKTEAGKYLKYIKIWLSEIEPKCATLRELKRKKEMRELMFPPQLATQIYYACSEKDLMRLMEAAEKHNERVNSISYSVEKRHFFRVPTLGNSFEQLGQRKQKIEDILVELKPYLDKPEQKS